MGNQSGWGTSKPVKSSKLDGVPTPVEAHTSDGATKSDMARKPAWVGTKDKYAESKKDMKPRDQGCRKFIFIFKCSNH